MFYIRTDANEIIATGHMMRCLAIADEIKAKGEEVTFLTADEKGQKLAEEKGYPVICLNSKWSEMESELGTLLGLVDKRSIQKILVDSYQATERYLAALQEHTSVIYMDDLDAFAYPCDRIINYEIYAKQCSYAKETRDKQHLLGPKYIPLRKQFRNMPQKEIRQEINQLLVLSGGSDTYHFTRDFLKTYLACGQMKGFTVTIICGRYHEDYQELARMTDGRSDIILKRSVSDIERYMQRADIAVSAGGTTLYELCACGTPTFSYVLADNQKKNAAVFDKIGLIPYCGDIRKEDCILQILEQIYVWREKWEERKKVAERMQKLVDGKGAMRLAEKLI